VAAAQLLGFGVLLSYQMHPMRPRFSLEKLKEIFSVSQWMLVNSIASYVNRNLDKILIGRRANATIVGGYTLADEISAMPSTEVLAPLNRVLFPAFVAAKNDLAELKRLYLLAQGVQSLLGISAGVGLALVAHDAVLVLLGAKWLFVVPFVQVLALANVVEAITTSGRYVLLTMGKIRSTALVNWLQVVLFAIGALLVLPEGDALQLASIRVVTVLAEQCRRTGHCSYRLTTVVGNRRNGIGSHLDGTSHTACSACRVDRENSYWSGQPSCGNPADVVGCRQTLRRGIISAG
jgi:lipopolysaccharide exporter